MSDMNRIASMPYIDCVNNGKMLLQSHGTGSVPNECRDNRHTDLESKNNMKFTTYCVSIAMSDHTFLVAGRLECDPVDDDDDDDDAACFWF